MKKTKIVSTIGPSSDSIEILEKMIDLGLNVARINFSHGSHEEHYKRIENIKKARENKNSHTGIMLDTKGPEIRTKDFGEKFVELEKGQKYTITTRDVIGDSTICSVTYEDLNKELSIGNKILIDDGLIELEVEDIDDKDIICTVLNSGKISGRKGINIPMVSIKLPAVTEKDIEDIVFGINQNVDFIAASFVRKVEDVLDVRRALENNGGENIKIISKIENYEGVKNIEKIIEVSDGIMVARGDLGVEILPEEVPIVQKNIIKKCNELGKPVITATQMLDSMIRNPRPTRAEVTDVANAILDGTDAIMLSGETAIGKYPLEAVETMKKIAIKTEDSIDYKRLLLERSEEGEETIAKAISYSACSTAKNLNVRAILTPTSSGYTAISVSRYRPKAYIVAPTQLEKVARYLSLIWGIYPVIAKRPTTTDELINNSIETSMKKGLVKSGDVIVITAGIPVGVSGSTNMIKVHRVGEERIKGTGIGSGKVEGRVSIISKIEDLESKFKEGDILVSVSIDKSMIKYIERSSGIITEEGGYTSNGAIVGLNLEKPTIVGCEDIKEKLKDGEIITIDAKKGVIYKGRTNILE